MQHNALILEPGLHHAKDQHMRPIYRTKTRTLGALEEGQSLSGVGRALGKHAESISVMLAINGGISPLHRTRSRLALTMPEREGIS